MNGSFFFRDGEEGAHSIELRILPHGEVEVEEMFVIELSIMSGELEVDPQAGSITLKVLHCTMPAIFNQLRLLNKDHTVSYPNMLYIVLIYFPQLSFLIVNSREYQ